MPTKKKSPTAKTSPAKKSTGKSKPSTAKSVSKSPAKKSSAVKSKTAMKAKSTGSKPAASKSKTATKTKAVKPAQKRKTQVKSPTATKAKSTRKTSTSKRKPQTKSKGIIASAIDAVAGMFTPDDSPNAVELLKTDHDTVEQLFEKVKANEDGNNVATFKKIKAELDVHAHIEEMIFYPHLLEKGDKELKKIVREGIEEHGQVKMFLSELDALTGDSATFKAKLQVLMEDVEHHVKEEEDEMFPMVEDQIPAEMLQRLGSLMEGEKIKVKKMGGPPPPKRKAAAAARK